MSSSHADVRKGKFERALGPLSSEEGDGTVDLEALRDLLWAGAPQDAPQFRSKSWTLVLGVAPNARERYDDTLARKRKEYFELVQKSIDNEKEEQQLMRQIRVDLPRTSVGHLARVFQNPALQSLMERVLFVWAIRHPACGYVQGINDLLTPFLLVFLATEQEVTSFDDIDVDVLIEKDPNAMDRVEADVYGCLSKILDNIQDHYTAGQPGIQRTGLDFLQFAFRWVNCLLARELPLNCVVRLWDTYIAEAATDQGGSGTSDFTLFHEYLCAVFLVYWSPQLRVMDFQQLLIFMQRLPTGSWGSNEIETLLAEAYVLKTLFSAAPRHFS
eukprot:GEMP01050377.1.p1 GENE.GEMP01050377.1~~GEMP01050377.1.p1  ORF type:complete len:338 (+),score=46.52 GEMP01050377.1:28-1014(+)